MRVRVGEGYAWIQARVLLDLGEATLIVARTTPKSTKRARREDVRSDPKKPRPATPARAAITTPKADLKSLYCEDGCAMQRQASPPSRAEMAGGSVAVCGRWLVSRSAPTKSEPSCVRCRALLGIPPAALSETESESP